MPLELICIRAQAKFEAIFGYFQKKAAIICGQQNDNAVFYCGSTAHTGLFHKLSESVN